jgi:hypothetical protein
MGGLPIKSSHKCLTIPFGRLTINILVSKAQIQRNISHELAANKAGMFHKGQRNQKFRPDAQGNEIRGFTGKSSRQVALKELNKSPIDIHSEKLSSLQNPFSYMPKQKPPVEVERGSEAEDPLELIPGHPTLSGSISILGTK